MKIIGKLAVLAGLGLAFGCAGGIPAAHAGTHVSIRIGVAPPPPRWERIPAPRAGFVWAPGYWRWSGATYIWVGGRWYPRRVGYRYVRPRWHRVRGGWRFNAGHWRRVRHHRGWHHHRHHRHHRWNRGHRGWHRH